jgi:hypothetical protein
MDENALKFVGSLLGIFFVGIPAIVILWAAMFAICKLLYEDFFRG